MLQSEIRSLLLKLCVRCNMSAGTCCFSVSGATVRCQYRVRQVTDGWQTCQGSYLQQVWFSTQVTTGAAVAVLDKIHVQRPDGLTLAIKAGVTNNATSQQHAHSMIGNPEPGYNRQGNQFMKVPVHCEHTMEAHDSQHHDTAVSRRPPKCGILLLVTCNKQRRQPDIRSAVINGS